MKQFFVIINNKKYIPNWGRGVLGTGGAGTTVGVGTSQSA